MVIIRTSATEVSIQAVSPELGAHAVKILASQGGGDGAGAAASCAKEGSIKTSAASTVKKRTKARDLDFLCINLFAFMTWPLHLPSLELGLKCCAATLSRANPQGLFDIGDKNLAVTNLACAC